MAHTVILFLCVVTACSITLTFYLQPLPSIDPTLCEEAKQIQQHLAREIKQKEEDEEAKQLRVQQQEIQDEQIQLLRLQVEEYEQMQAEKEIIYHKKEGELLQKIEEYEQQQIQLKNEKTLQQQKEGELQQKIEEYKQQQIQLQNEKTQQQQKESELQKQVEQLQQQQQQQQQLQQQKESEMQLQIHQLQEQQQQQACDYRILYGFLLSKVDRYDVVKRCWNKLYHPCHYFSVHIDNDTIPSDHWFFRYYLEWESVTNNVFVVRNRIGVEWATFTVVQAEFLTIEEALNRNVTWNATIWMSETHYPLQTTEKIAQIVKYRYGQNYFAGAVTKFWSDQAFRYPQNKGYPWYITPTFCSQWSIISYEASRFLVQSNFSREIIRWTNYGGWGTTFDEWIPSTILFSSTEFKNTTVIVPRDKDAYYDILWKDAQAHPYPVRPEDLQTMIDDHTNNRIFIRKVDMESFKTIDEFERLLPDQTSKRELAPEQLVAQKFPG